MELIETMWQCDDDAEIGREIIKEFLPELMDVDIAFLRSSEQKKKQGKLILGQCIKVNKNYSWCCPYDFMIVLYEPNIYELNELQLKILIYHELLHIGFIEGENGIRYYVNPHDIEEFDVIIDKFGVRWTENG